MPFQTDNAWPAGLLTIFEHGHATHSTFENRYFGPYDKLLNYCFGSEFTFHVAPRPWNPPTGLDIHNTRAVNFILFLVVFNSNNKPVLIVEVKDDSWAQKAELRYHADKLMRDRYSLMLYDCPTPRLWGLSILGTSMRVYCGNKASYEVTPHLIPLPHVIFPSFLAGEWDLDLLSQEGFEKMKEIVTDILTHTQNA